MKITRTSRMLALILALIMSISAVGAIGISAEEETPEAATCFDVLLSENGYGFGTP